MKKDVVIVGGGPAGIVTALTAKEVYPEKSVLVIKDIPDGVIPCAIPYMIHSLADPEQNRMGTLSLEQAGVEIVEGEVTELDIGHRSVVLRSGGEIGYERLVLATGSAAVRPQIPGINKPNVLTIGKSLRTMTTLRQKAQDAKNIVIIGGGFIGAELADELVQTGATNVHLVELEPKILRGAFDGEFCDEAAQILESAGVKVWTGCRVLSIDGTYGLEQVTLQGEVQLPADLVLVSVGSKPATELAARAGIRTVDNGSIWVDDYMRTTADGVFAVGDCALKRDFFTRQAAPIQLASTATAEARIAGTNLFQIRVMRQIQGTIAAFSTVLGERAFASAGRTLHSAEKDGFCCVTATATAPDRHPGSLGHSVPLTVKLVFADHSGILLGGQISGGPSVGELINVIAVGIQKRMTVREIDMLQIATHPRLTPAPTVHPLINAAHRALAHLRTQAPAPAPRHHVDSPRLASAATGATAQVGK